MTTIRFKTKDELSFYQKHARDKYNLSFSKYLRMLIQEDLGGKRVKNRDELQEENALIEELRSENELLKKEISLLKEHITLIMDLNTNRILQKIQELTILPEQVVRHEKSILKLLKGKKRYSLAEISEQTGISEKIAVRILDELIEQEKVKLFQDMRYGRIA